ncbi:hypothetical protein ABZ400_34320 [Streptomyces sp. NPDC005897]|uniref:hypothetical protein n=1 Tax=Streptomyces sp. NPDC005897 TaxID=3157081 RepID=UPI0033F1CB64
MPELPALADLHKLSQLRDGWGVSVHSLLYRCRELGLLPESSASRVHQRLHGLQGQPGTSRSPWPATPANSPRCCPRPSSLPATMG